MDESFPERPSLFFHFVLPPRSKYFFLNFRIADPHTATPKALGGLSAENTVHRLCSRDDTRRNLAAAGFAPVVSAKAGLNLYAFGNGASFQQDYRTKELLPFVSESG